MAKAFVTHYNSLPYQSDGNTLIDFEFVVVGSDVPNRAIGLGGSIVLGATISAASLKAAIRAEVDRVSADNGLSVDSGGLFIPSYVSA